MHWLRIDVSGLIGKPGNVRDYVASDTFPGLVGGLGKVDESAPVSVDLTLQARDDGIGARGRVEGEFALSCSRCLVEYRESFAFDLDEMFYFDPEQAERRDGYEVEDQTVDLEPMLRDAIVLNIPLKPVHAEGCLGLCPLCGADLNVTHCEHGEQPVDVRWAALRDLKVDEQ